MRVVVVIMRAGGVLLAAEVSGIVEVLPPLATEPCPLAPTWVSGLFNFRGDLLPLVDAALLLGRPPTPPRTANRVVVMPFGDSAAGVRRFGLKVDAVTDIEAVSFDAPGTHPGLSVPGGDVIGPAAIRGGGVLHLFRPSEVFTREQADVLFARAAGAPS